MKYLIQRGYHNEKAKWVVDHEVEFDTRAEATTELESISAGLDASDKTIQNIKMYDSGEDNPNKLPRLYHYITNIHPGVVHDWFSGTSK